MEKTNKIYPFLFHSTFKLKKNCGLHWRKSYTTSIIERVLFLKCIIPVKNLRHWLEWKLICFLQSEIKGMLLWLDIYLKETLVAFSKLFQGLSCSIMLLAEIKVNFGDGEWLQILCILYFTLYDKYINQFKDVSRSLKWY